MTKRTFGQLLREERECRHWSQAQLAEKVGIDVKTISRWETGRTFPPPHYQKELLSVLGKDLPAELNQGNRILASHFPSRNPFFIGREAILDQIHTRLSQGKTTVALGGLGGMGKTQIAVEYAYRYQEDYQFILWATADSQNSLLHDCMEIAKTLHLPGMHEQDQQSVIDAVKQWLHNHHEWLLILDNVEDPDLIDDFHPRLDQGCILVTTQDSYVFEPTLQLQPLDQEAGVYFLFYRSGLITTKEELGQISAEERTAAQVLVKQMDGLPLALDQAAAYMRTAQIEVAQYLHLYQKRRKELLSIRGRPVSGHNASLVTTISLSCERVQAVPGALDTLEFCAFLHPDHIPEEFLREDAKSPFSQLTDNDHFLLTEALRELLRYSLVFRHKETETISVHRLVQAVLRDLMEENRRRDWTECVVEVVYHTLSAINSLNRLHDKRYLLHAQHCATWIEDERIESEEAMALLTLTGHYLQEQGQYTEAEQLYKRSFTIRSRTREPERSAAAEQLYNYAVLYLNQGKYEQSEVHLQQALALLQTMHKPGDPILVTAENTLAELYSAQGRYKEAQTLFLSALEMREALYEEGHPLIATTCHCLAMNYMYQGEYREAEHFFQRALKVRKQAFGDNHPYVAETLHGLAMLYTKQGALEKASPLFEKALEAREQAFGAEHVTIAEELQGQAVLHITQKQYAEAEALLQQALTIYKHGPGSAHPDALENLNILGMLYALQSRYTEAERLLRQALKLRQENLGSFHSDVIQSFIALGQLYTHQERWIEADWYFHQALRTVKERLKTEDSLRDRKIYLLLLEILGLPNEM